MSCADWDMKQYLHPNRLAPRCLPCNYTDPAETFPPQNKSYVGFRAPRVSHSVCSALPCLVLPCPALSCPASPCPASTCPALLQSGCPDPLCPMSVVVCHLSEATASCPGAVLYLTAEVVTLFCRHALAEKRMCVHLTICSCLLMATAIQSATSGTGHMEVGHYSTLHHAL